ncbi:MAG: T9SS type A sorting domain-containing protein [Bacteroidota bacterium]
MKRFATLTIVLMLFTLSMAMGQWQYIGVFPPAGLAPGDTVQTGNIHGIAVDPDGKVWIQNYYAYPRDTILVPNVMTNLTKVATPDSIVPQQIAVRMLYCYNADGSPASFSPIKFVTVNGVQDTLGGASLINNTHLVWDKSNSPNTGRGLRADQDGNIIATYFCYLYRINYLDGTGMAKVNATNGASGVAVGIDGAGNIYDNAVASTGAPLKVYDKDFNYLFNAVDTLTSFSRSLEASYDGLDIYWAGYTNHAVYDYKSTDGGVTYGVCDTIAKGFDCESFGWNRKDGYLWMSAGSFNDLPNRWPGLVTEYRPSTWYAYDPASGTMKDSLIWVFAKPENANERPRGIAFSPSGDTAYVCVFGDAGVPGVRMYKRTVTGLKQTFDFVPENYTLSQNYPNPFNPTTEIQFTIARGGKTTLRVYDLLGREVATLVNENLAPGTYKYGFTGMHLSSGTYIYQLTSGQARITKKMALVK